MSEAMDQPAGSPGNVKPGEGGDGSMEPGTCQELLHRLRELEAENSALAQANENQRETYERCLDEVANHVVQALLNQKDLREECIKLKKRVFDLERQNQMLSALFQQKLQLTAGSLPQVCWEQQLRPGGPGPPAAPPPALDALSPFLRKKAQILEPPSEGPGFPEPINGELCGPPQPEPSPWAPYLLLGPGSSSSSSSDEAGPVVPTYPQLTLEVPRAPEILRSPGVPSSPCLPESCPYESGQEKSLDKGVGRRPGDPGYTPLRDRLAALGKLKTGPEGPQGPEKNGVPARPGTEKARGAGRSCLTKVELAKSRLAGALCPQSPTKVAPRPVAPPATKEPPKPDKGKGPPWADSIEEKVMKGIEENVLRLQGQERAPGTEAKHRNTSSIASWFGLKKSKLPALNRRTEATKGKEGASGGSPLRKEVKMEARKLEAESLNISKLMAKAEDLRRALEEEKAYLSSRARPRPGGPVPGPSAGLGQVQGQLAGMYQGADTFMQQLLNRVDGKELPPKSWREPKPEYGDFQPASSDPKNPWPACGPQNGLVGPLQGCGKPPGKPSCEPGRREEMPSEDSLAEPVPTSHFTGPECHLGAKHQWALGLHRNKSLPAEACGSLTRTLDSGIGTFPPPDHGSTGTPSKNLPKTKPPRLEPSPGVPPARPPPLTKVPRRAHTLEREVPGIEELLVSGRHPSMPAFPALLTAAPGHRGHQTCPDDPCEDPAPPPPVQLAKNWTFPNARAASGSSDPFLCPPRHLEGLPRTPMDLALPMDRKRSLEPSRPAAAPQGPAFGGSRTPSTSDMGEEGRVASGGPTGLETSESLSDSLYDSLSSCGSQG
ncbi:nck-associated protein 5-like protein [Camelus ferus]|nr:nck-associated protein 5-like protein [Camelus ferus]